MSIADAFILMLPRGSSLDGWARVGRLGREAHLLRGLSGQYSRTVLVTRGGGDLETLRRAVGPGCAERHELIALEGGPVGASAPGDLEAALASRLGGARTAVVQTSELADAALATGLVGALGSLGIGAALLARGGCVPSRIVAWRHGPHSARAAEAGSDEQRLCEASSMVVGSSTPMLDDLCWRFGIDPGRTRMVRDFVPAEAEPVGAAERDPELVFSWGALEPTSRFETVIEAVGELPEPTRASLTLEIAGEGSQRGRLLALAERLGVRLELPGEIGYEAFLERCRRCAVYAHAAVHNPEPIGVLEAMSCGAPVVAADVPGGDELIENGVTGVRVPGAAAPLSYALAGVLPDADWREMMGQCAAQRVRSRSAVERVVGELSAVHRETLAAAGLDREPARAAQNLRRRSA